MLQTIHAGATFYPTSHSLLATSALLADIARDYDIGTPLSCQLWLSGVTDTYVVITERGRYLLRVYRTGWRTDDDVAYELEVLTFLQRNGVPVAAPIPRKDGRWFYGVEAPEGWRQLALFTYAKGREAYIEETFSLQFGRSIGAIHKATDHFHTAHSRFHIDISELLDKPLTVIQPLLVERSSEWAYLSNLANSLRDNLTKIPAPLLDWGFCHGDCHGGNAHFDNATVTVFDFDCCGPGWGAYDLVTFRWVWHWHDPQAALKHWQLFLQGYREERTIGEANLNAVSIFVALREFWFLGLHIRIAPERGYRWLSDAFLNGRFTFLREWEQSYLPASLEL